MLCLKGKNLYILLAVLISLSSISCAQHSFGSSTGENVPNIAGVVKNLLTNIERSPEWNENLHFGLIFAEFLIKQKVRFYEPTRFESQLYDDLLQTINRIRSKILKKHGAGRLATILQRNALLLKPVLRENEIDTHLEYKSLIPTYNALMDAGSPSPELSDFCMLHISELENCNDIRPECLKVIGTESQTYGYHRLHQLLILYILMHNTCSRQYASELTYQIWASHHCSEVYREHRILSSAISKPRRDLYIEQSSVCGLFGFKEYFNKREIEKIRRWEKFGFCDCGGRVYLNGSPWGKSLCHCADHLHSVSLLFYVNAMLFLNDLDK